MSETTPSIFIDELGNLYSLNEATGEVTGLIEGLDLVKIYHIDETGRTYILSMNGELFDFTNNTYPSLTIVKHWEGERVSLFGTYPIITNENVYFINDESDLERFSFEFGSYFNIQSAR